jgi:hypothetical protein
LHGAAYAETRGAQLLCSGEIASHARDLAQSAELAGDPPIVVELLEERK